MTRVRSGLAALLGLLILGISGPLWAPAGGSIQVGRATLVGRSFYGSTDIDMVYRIAAANHVGASVSNLAASVTSASPNTRILDGGLSYPKREIADGEAVDSVDTISIRQKRSIPFVLSAIAVQFSYDLVPSNQPPVANAGPDQTLPVGTMARLDGSHSTDPDGNPLSYQWSLDQRPAQSAAVVSNANLYNPTLPIDKRGSYLLSLIVNDGQLNSAPDQVRIDTVNSAPVAAAGSDASAFINETVLLDGSASSDVDGDPLRFNWSLIERPLQSTALLDNADTDHPSFTLDRAGNYTAELVVNDGVLDSAPDQVVISTENSRPIADAGADQAATLGQTVALDGSASYDPDLDSLNYAWSFTTRPAGSTVAIIDNTLAAASFVPDALGDYIAQLIVSDGTLDSAADTAIVTVTAGVPTNQRPVVNAGADQAVTLPAAATLAGTATDDGKPNPPAHLTTTWSLVSGPPSGVVFGSPTTLSTSATFTAPGVYQLRLTASDSLLSQSSEMQVTVSDGAPVFQAVADRTIALGTRYQQLLVASDANVGDTLSYALPTAPTGAALSPSPLVDWTPTAAQLGLNTFIATVADTAGHTATTTFKVTVEHTNQAPQLAPQPNVILPVGTAFSRTLQATDPDAGDTLTFALVSGPAGMTLTGNALTWPTAGVAPGDAAVTVSVTDAGGLTDSKPFTVTLTPAVPGPVARDDQYQVHLGETLTIPAAGVLGNDSAFSGNPLSAIKLTDPDKGTLNALNADGGFNYTAPATLPPVSGLNPVVVWRGDLGSNGAFVLAADFDHNGVVDYVSNHFGNLRAWRGSDGSQLWQFDQSNTTHANVAGCRITYGDLAQYTLGDVTGSGDIYLFNAATCDGDVFADRLFAVNASHVSGGKVAAQWLSPRLSRPHPGAYAAPWSASLPEPPITPSSWAAARGSVLTLAKLTAGGSTKLLTRFLSSGDDGNYYDTPYSDHQTWAGCRTVTGLPADEGRACKATFVIDAGTGVIEQVLTAPNTAKETFEPDKSPSGQANPIVADLDGDGQVEIISGGDVWKLVDGAWTLAWQAQFTSVTPGLKHGFEPASVAVADLDGDGLAEVIINITGADSGPIQNARGIHIFNHDGTLRRTIPIPFTWINGLLSVADVDGDGAPEILMAGDSFVFAYRQDGSLLWAKLPPDIINDVVPPLAPLGMPRTADSPVYVYDLNLDGVPEVILQCTRRLFILNGRTGADLWSIDTESEQYYMQGNPLLVDADDDGHIDILVHVRNHGGIHYQKGSAMRISGADHNWAPGPKVQNQLNFRPKATNDTAQILYDGSVTRDFRQQIQQGTVSDPRLAQSAAFTYKANDGAADSAPATVAIDIQPPNSPPVITSTPPTALFRVSPDGVNTIYTITAVDPDQGDTVHYELVSSSFDTTYFSGPTVDSVTGNVGLYSCRACGAGRIVMNVAAVDSHGARTEQSFLVDLSSIAVAVPNVIGQLLPDARTAIEAASLTPLVVAELFGSQPAGTVIGQDPLPGTANVARSATVRLTVSKGPQPFTMPFVVGDQLAPTNALLTGAGLTVNVTTAFSTTIPVGDIMAQAPAAGTALLPGSAPPVALTVSAGGPLPAPIASLVLEPGPGPLLRLAGDELQYQAVAILTDGTSANVTLTAAWSSSATSTATISPTGVAKAIQVGTTTISASLAGKTVQGTLNVAARALGDNTPPTAAITSPADGGTVIGPTAIIGTASDTNFLRYELAYALAGDEHYTLIAEGTTAVTDGALGTLDPTTLVNDLYTLRLTVFDRSENESVATRTVRVSGGRKVGLFTLAFQDLNVALAGVPITVTRSYDSRDKAKGDFGIGWRLGLQTLRLRTNRELGTGWVRTVSGPMVSLAPTSEHKVSVTLPDGRVEEFDMIVSPTSNIGSLDFTNVTGYQPRPGTLGQLQALGNNSLLIASGGAQVELVDDATLNTYSPTLYRYTTADGTQIEISPTAGVKKVTDLNGNAITFGPSGIIHSGGQSVTFARDAQNRIVSVTDLNGNVQTYTYDGNGDLAAHTDPTGGVSRFTYDRHHGLIEIRNALGTRVTRNEYDSAGRLIAMTDADGHAITFTHNDAAQEELVADRLGRQARFVYDAQGNVVQEERSVTINGTLVNAVTTLTYDALGNETSRVDPDGLRTASTFSGVLPLTQVVDPTGVNLATTFAYSAFNDVSEATDAGGRAFRFFYDARGNLISYSMPDGGPGTVLSNAQGQPIQRTDALGNTTSIKRDPAGRIIREEVFDTAPTLLRRMDFTYDANGNKTSETLHRTIDGVLTALTTHFAYDAANRLVAVTDPSGGTSRTEYDASGRVTARVDPLGRRMTYIYDVLGRLIRTTYPDGSAEMASYDAESNQVAMIDRTGRMTSYAYDEVKRLVETTLPDGSATRTIYSPGGRIAATIDARGNRTDYTYDTAGRRLSTTLSAVADGHGGIVRPHIASTLTELGAPATATDPNGRSTTFKYDAEGRLTQTTYPDASTLGQTFDAQGRRTSVTNEEGEITTYEYDGLGHLTSISGLAGDARYTYDEAGNLVVQTDALGQVTRLRYDVLNRLIERRYPGGETEQFAYDAVGNLVARTDGLGRVALLVYDVIGRLVKKTLPGGASVHYTYFPDDQRKTVTDMRGTMTFGYDDLGRLTLVTLPNDETLAYARDANGNLLSLTSPAMTANYRYDALDRLVEVDTPEGKAQVNFDLAGNRVRQVAANGIQTDFVYDSRYRPTLLSHQTAEGVVLQSYATVYSLSGRRSQVSEFDGSVETFGYDANGRLVSEVRTGTNPLTITHSYDAAGNRLQTVRNGAATTFSYNGNSQLISDGTATYDWDGNGNLVRRTRGATVTQFGYDVEGRLVSILGGGLANEYAYDDDGHRVRATTATGTTHFLVDTANNTGVSQVLEERDEDGNLQATYSYGSELLAMADGTAPRFHLRDSSRDVRALTNSLGTVTDLYQYDAYGNTVSAVGGTVNPYRYRGERFDVDSGLYQLRARYYNPALGQFTSRDAFEGRTESPVSRHRYLYANGDPTNYIDPTGRESLIGISVAQAIDTMIDEAFFFGTAVVQGCNLKARLDVVGQTILWGGLSASALTYLVQSEFIPGKTAINLVGFNPAALGDVLKELKLSVEFPFNLKVSGKKANGIGFNLGFGLKGISGGASATLATFPFGACGVPVGKATLKAGFSTGTNLIDKGYGKLSLSAELAVIPMLEFSYPILEFSYSEKGFGEEAFGKDLLK